MQRAVTRYGVGGAIEHARHRVAARVSMREEHLWYELDLRSPRPKRSLAPEFSLRAGNEHDLESLDRLAAIPPEDARARLSAGNDLWLVDDGGPPVFSCWTFHEQTPVAAARGGTLELPPGTACLEDSITSAAARGRGVAPAAWVQIADVLEQRGVERLITKVGTDNAPSRRAVEKSGFKAFAVMRFSRTGPLSRVRMQPIGESGPQSLFTRLAARLGAGVDRAGPAPAAQN